MTLTATILITTIPNQSASATFQISGTYQLNESTWTDTLVYEDDGGPTVAIAAPAVNLGISSWSYTHAALPAGTHTVSIKDPLTGTVATSNSFTVGVIQSITANTPSGVIAGTAFTFTGTLVNFSTIPTLSWTLNGTTQANSLLGVTLTGWSTSLTVASAGTYTISVSNGAITSNIVTFTAAPVTVTHVITPNAPTATSSPNYVFYDTFTSLNDITDAGGAGTTSAVTITPGSGSFTDGAGHVWTVTSGAVVQEDGVNASFTANVAQLSLVNGTIWHENTSGTWYYWTQTGAAGAGNWTSAADPFAGGGSGSWMNHYAFGGSEYTLSANTELEYFTSSTRTPGFSPFTLQNGGAGPGLIITCDTTPQATFKAGHTPANPAGLPYNSGVIVSCIETNGEPMPGLFAFTYGLIEIQALLPGGPGAWAGFAMYALGTPGSPGGSGELDIIENGGTDLNSVWGSLHSSTGGYEAKATVTDFTKNRHIYAVNWQSDFLTFYVDGNQYGQTPTPADMIGHAFYIAIDFAMQGNAGQGFDGVPTAATPAPNTMSIDFVRVSQGTTTGGSTIGAGSVVNFTGTISGYTTAPSLTYQIGTGAKVAITGVTTTGWSIQFTAPTTAGAYNLTVSDGTTSGTTGFQVGAVSKTITPQAPSISPVAGQSFTFTGGMTGYTTIPALTYSINNGTSTAITGVSVSGWAMTLTIASAGSYTIVVSDGAGTSGSVTVTVTAAAPTGGARLWYQVIGGDRTLLTTPQQTTATFITSGTQINQLRGLTAANVRSYATTGFVSPFWVSSSTSDVLCTFHDSTGTISDFQMHVPAGAYSENGSTGAGDNAAGFIDTSIPYKYVTINDCRIGSNSGNATASGVVSTTNKFIMCGPGAGSPGGMIIQDATGPTMMDAITGSITSTIWENGDNVSGCVTYYDLQQCNADPNYVIQHMVAVNLDRSVFSNTGALVWPLVIGDTAGTGSIPEGVIIMIPASTARPTGQSRAFYVLFDLFRQQGGMFNNVTSGNQIAIKAMPGDSATAALVASMASAFINVLPYLCILNYALGTAGAQYGVSTLKGRLAGATAWSDAFPAPPSLDFSPTGGNPVKPDTFGAWQAANGLGEVYDTIWGGGTPSSGSVTWNPADLAGGITLSNGNYTATTSGSTTAYGAPQGVRATAAVGTSKLVIWETTFNTITQNCAVGLADTAHPLNITGGLGANADSIGAYPATGTGSQPAQSAYYNGSQLTSGNVSSVAGAVITHAVSGTSYWFSDAQMRVTAGVNWNNITTPNPATGTGGFSFSGIPSAAFPAFATGEAGSSVVLNDGTSPFSAFAQAFLTANPSATTLSGQVTSGGGGGGTTGKVIAPLTGSVTTGSWVVNQHISLASSPSGLNYLQYNYLLPAQYTATLQYPIVFFGHPNDSGMNGSTYPKDGTNFVTGASYGTNLSLDTLFNNVAFRQNYPCIFVAPQCDQTLDLSGANANANFGGYADSQNSGWNERACNALMTFMIANFPVDPSRRYVMGTSLGGIMTLAQLVDNNQQNGPSGFNLWTAGVTLSDQLYRPSTANSSVFSRMASVPLLAISTPSDNVPSSYDQPAWTSYTGNTSYPTQANYDSGGMAAIRAGSSQYYYIAMPSGSPWNTMLALNANGGDGTAWWTWLFNQTGQTAVASESAPGTVVTTVGPTISASPTPGTAGTGNAFAITSGGQISNNGAVLGGSAVTELCYIAHTAFQLGSGAWWGPMTATDTGAAVASSPLPTILLSGTTVPSGSPSGSLVGSITVTTGNSAGAIVTGVYTWTLALGSGGSASGFAISGANLVTSSASPTGGNVVITATNAGVTGSPFSQTFAVSVGAAAGAAIPLGAYIGGAGGSASDWSTFKGYFPGVQAQLFTCYMDHTNDYSTLTNYSSYVASSLVAIGGTAIIPQLGWPLSTNANGSIAAAVVAGNLDAALKNTITNFRAQGYTKMYIRIGWEMNQATSGGGQFTGSNGSTWIAAFQHMYTVLHNQATTSGVTLTVIWCPGQGVNQNDGSVNIAAMWPGNAYCDAAWIDFYDSPINGENPLNVGTSSRLQMNNLITFAAGNGKPFGFGEMAATTTGWANNFVQALKNAQPWGTTCNGICFWDTTASGPYLFASNPSVVTIWQNAFGSGGSVHN